MDYSKTGSLIRSLRKEKNLTQQQLADRIHVSDKAVSKWERGMGCPDVSLLPELSDVLGIDLEALLSGDLDANPIVGGNMKKLKFYVCPDCGNLLTSTAETAISCCSKKLVALNLQKAEDGGHLAVEQIEHDYYVSSEHEMTREHHIAFVAFLTGDLLILKKLYPEWNLQVRIPDIGHGMLVWFCTRHGLYYQVV